MKKEGAFKPLQKIPRNAWKAHSFKWPWMESGQTDDLGRKRASVSVMLLTIQRYEQHAVIAEFIQHELDGAQENET